MRSLLLLFGALIAALPATAQGVYVADATGGSVTYARTAETIERYGDSSTRSVNAVGAALETVSGRGQASIGVSYSSPLEGVSVYGLSGRFGFLAMHQHQGDPVTFAFNGGVGIVGLTGEGLGSATTQYVSLGIETGGTIPLGAGGALVPSVAAEVAVPFGEDAASPFAAFGGALGLSVRAAPGVQLVFEPGLVQSNETTSFSFSLKVLGLE